MSLARNAAFNLAGAAVPAVAALLTVPVLIAHLGSDEYGLLILVTSIVGYFALLDINATAGSVKFIAQYHAVGDRLGVRRVFGFGLLVYLFIGIVGGAAIALFAQVLAERLFRIPPSLIDDSVTALRWGGLAFFAGQIQAYVQSVPQALQRYDITGRLEAVFGTLASVVTMAVAWAGFGLVGIVVARLVLSLVNIAVLVHRIRGLLPDGLWARPDRAIARAVASFSAYAYLARLAAISAANTDKLLIGAMVDMTSLAWYSVPFLLVNRIFQLAFRLAQVMLPRASALAAAGQQEQLRATYLDASRYVAFINACLALLLVALAPEIIRYWAGGDFGHQALVIIVLLSTAVFADSLCNIASLVNDGLGHPAVSGTSAVLRALLGFAAAWWAIGSYGILGAAVAQMLVSMAATLAFLLYVHGRTVPVGFGDLVRRAWVPVAPVVLCGALAGWLSIGRPVLPPLSAAALLAGLLLLAAAYGWLVVLQPAHRIQARSMIADRLARRAP